MNPRSLIVVVATATLLIVSACEKKPAGDSGAAAAPASARADASARCPHEIKQEKCPFCNPGLVEAEGMCGEHGVPEALCAACRPYLKAAFRAKGDWCQEHNTPESQCAECNPELKEKMRPGQHGVAPAGAAAPAPADACLHTIAAAKCPFCTPSLIESQGACAEHGVAEALCVTCRPYLEAAFKAKGDWCTEHATPESQCVECNPELRPKPKDGPG